MRLVLVFWQCFLLHSLIIHRLKNIAWLCLPCGPLLLSIAVIFVGREYNGSKRWLWHLVHCHFNHRNLQRLRVILFLASYVTHNVKKMYRMRTLIKIMIVVLPIVGLVGASNLSTAIIILSIAVVLIFVASPKYGQFIFLGAGAGQDLWESFLLWRATGWNGLQSGRIRKLMKRDIRLCRDCMQLGVEDYLEEGWDRVFKAWLCTGSPK